jgi:hypothetical protein
MCMSHKMSCSCGATSAELTMRDEILGPEVVSELYCPACSPECEIDPDTMLADNGWVIVFDMEVAAFRSQRMTPQPAKLTPDFIFDEGYCTWAGYCPGDLKRAAEEKAEIVKLMKVNPRAYVKAITSWGKERAVKLSDAGWRKAKAAL